MFRNDTQRARVCKAVCASIGLSSLWTEEGPEQRAKELLESDGGPLSHGEKVMVFCAWALWNGRGGLTLTEAIDTLDRKNLTLVGEILIALAAGPDAVDDWLENQSLSA